MGIKCGIVGLPNVGKSTLFNALTRAQIAAENYPFCTIDPNVGVVPVPDPRLDALAAIVQAARRSCRRRSSSSTSPAWSPARRKGEGLGNKFLAHIRETDAIAHVVRCFEDDDIVHVAGKVDPISRHRDHRHRARARRPQIGREGRGPRRQARAKGGDKDAVAQAATLLEAHARASRRRQAGARDRADEDETALTCSELFLLTLKPVMYVANVARGRLREQSASRRGARARAKAEGAEVVPVCAAIEAEIAQLDEADRAEFLTDLGLDEPGLNRVIRAGYKLLGLQTYFTAGREGSARLDGARGATAPQAAGVIHTDFERGFIRAEVIAYDDFIAYKGEAGAKEAGKLRLEGKEYIVQEGDVMHFRFNV